ncbi:hypothetical protein N7539_007350 [Penicillium diatomitis]|uniref:Uncharacterized protein n=1 Tax=Penicillium diatomitis TaxID=2819901 RepID=A0A9W9WV01_9EURO|nr:uncharacterized protein N7539_007350 [Penicillium diatomitis]KAJ5477206.1 hypothetical protein N7539_007350 [Penicillium diatomitis]
MRKSDVTEDRNRGMAEVIGSMQGGTKSRDDNDGIEPSSTSKVDTARADDVVHIPLRAPLSSEAPSTIKDQHMIQLPGD